MIRTEFEFDSFWDEPICEFTDAVARREADGFSIDKMEVRYIWRGDNGEAIGIEAWILYKREVDDAA